MLRVFHQTKSLSLSLSLSLSPSSFCIFHSDTHIPSISLSLSLSIYIYIYIYIYVYIRVCECFWNLPLKCYNSSHKLSNPVDDIVYVKNIQKNVILLRWDDDSSWVIYPTYFTSVWFRSHLKASRLSSHTEELWYSEAVWLCMIIYQYIISVLRQDGYKTG